MSNTSNRPAQTKPTNEQHGAATDETSALPPVEQATPPTEQPTADSADGVSPVFASGRKIGPARFFELLGRDLWDFYRASILCCVAFAPGAVLTAYGLMGGWLLLTLAGGALAGLLGIPVVCGLEDTIFRALRDEPGYWWRTYKRAWRQNWKAALLPGLLFGLVVSLWIYLLRTLPVMPQVPVAVWVCVLVGLFLLAGFFCWLLAQVVLVALPFGRMVKNSGLFFMGFLPRTLAAALVQCVYWALILLYVPATLPLLLVTGFWLPMLLSLMLLYPALDKIFSLEKTIAGMRENEFSDSDQA